MSLALVAYYTFGAGVSSEAQYSGFVFTIAHPQRAIWGLWIVWCWSLWRYRQRTYEQLAELREELREDVFAEDMRIALARAKRVGNRLAAARKIDDQMPESAQIDGAVSVAAADAEVMRAKLVLGERSGHFRGYIPRKDGGRKYSLTASFYWPVGGMAFAKGNQHFAMELTRREASGVRLRAWFWALWRLPAFSEHFAPYLIAATAAIVGVAFEVNRS